MRVMLCDRRRPSSSRSLSLPHAMPPSSLLPPRPSLPALFSPPSSALRCCCSPLALSIKPGKVVIVLAGRYAGRKAIVVKTFDDATKEHKFGHALVAGIDRAPLKVTKSMGQKKIIKRSRVKPFIKYINYNHIMPTRYTVTDIDVRRHTRAALSRVADGSDDAIGVARCASDFGVLCARSDRCVLSLFCALA